MTANLFAGRVLYAIERGTTVMLVVFLAAAIVVQGWWEPLWIVGAFLSGMFFTLAHDMRKAL